MVDLRRELAQHHRATLRSIETGRIAIAERRLKAYLEFAEAFIEAAAARGIKFSSEAARSVSFLDWPTATQMIQNVWDGIAAAVKSPNQDLMLSALYLPIRFLEMSVKHGDFLFYRRMIRFYPYLLALSYGVSVAEARELVIDRSWRYLREFADYRLLNSTKGCDKSTRWQFIDLLLWTFCDLMKVAMDHSDVEPFAKIGRELNTLFDHLEVHGVVELEADELRAALSEERRLIWFGFGAWLLRSLVLQDAPRRPGYPDPKLVDATTLVRFFGIISPNLSGIPLLAETYLRAHGYRGGDSRWTNWLGETLPEREVHSVDYGRWLDYFYAVQGLLLSKSGFPDASDIPAPHRDLQFRMKDIRSVIEEITRNPRRWAPLLPFMDVSALGDSSRVEGLQERAEYFLAANDAAMKEWQRRQEERVIASPIDESRASLFREECHKGWSNAAWLVRVFEQAEAVREKSADLGATYMALHFLMPKEAFISEADTIFVGFGSDPGRQLGTDVNQALLDELESAVCTSSGITFDDIVDDALASSEKLGTMGDPPRAIIVAGDFDLERRFLSDDRFIPSWREQTPKFGFPAYIGTLKGIPVFFRRHEHKRHILIFNLKEIGRVIRYIPTADNYRGLLVRVKPVNQDQAENLVKSQPERLKTEDGTPRNKNEVIRELLLQVEVFIGAKLELEVEDVRAGELLPIE